MWMFYEYEIKIIRRELSRRKMVNILRFEDVQDRSLSDLMNESKSSNTPFVIKNFYKPMFDWNFAIEFLNKCMTDLEPNCYITKHGDYYFILQPSDEYMYVYSEYYELLNSSHVDGVISVPVILVSILNNVQNLGKHEDALDQMHLAISGSSHWTISDQDEVDLSPGDFIFLPVGISHNVISNTARIGLTFSSNRL